MVEHIDKIILIAGAVLIVLSLLTPLVNIFFRSRKLNIGTDVEEEEEENLPPLSLVITPHDNAYELERHLPTVLEQDYPQYEVIVVVSKGEDNTDDVLKRFQAKYPHLYVTFIPDSSRYMSRKKLAVTLGVKAAHHEWVCLTEPSSLPSSDRWLREMARQCVDGHDMVMGYTNYDDDTGAYKRFELLYNQLYLFRQAIKGRAYRHAGTNLLFRKEMFMDGRGYEGNLKYIRGEYDFIVNKYAEKGNTAVVLSPSAYTVECSPSTKTWRNTHLYYMESRKHLQRSPLHRLINNIDTLLLHVNYLLILAAIIVAAILLVKDHYNPYPWVLLGASLVALCITVTLRTVFARKVIQRFQEDIPTWKIIFYELSILWHRIKYMIQYARADKYDFISHKL